VPLVGASQTSVSLMTPRNRKANAESAEKSGGDGAGYLIATRPHSGHLASTARLRRS
jgi:hypothetical protein